jgi:hypothetical protein
MLQSKTHLNYDLLIKAGFTTQKINAREPQYLIPELLALGYNRKFLDNAGFSNADLMPNDLIRSSFGHGIVQNVGSVVYNSPTESTWQ